MLFKHRRVVIAGNSDEVKDSSYEAKARARNKEKSSYAYIIHSFARLCEAFGMVQVYILVCLADCIVLQGAVG